MHPRMLSETLPRGRPCALPQLIMPAALSLALKMRESPKPVSHIIAEFEKRRWREYERNRPAEPRRSHDKVGRPVATWRATC